MAVAHVQTVKTVDNSNSSPVTTGSITVTGGNALVLSVLEYSVVGAGSHLPVPTSAKLDNTTAGAQDVSFEAVTSANQSMRVTFYSWPNISGGAHTVTVVYTSIIPSNTLYFLTEFSGGLTTALVDGAGTGASGISTAAATGNFTAGNTNDFWLAATTTLAANPATSTAGTGWTIPTNGSETNSNANLCGAVEYIANPGTATENGQFTVKNSDWVAAIVAYKAASGGGGRGLFRVPSLTGMGVGGSFFRDPLQGRSL